MSSKKNKNKVDNHPNLHKIQPNAPVKIDTTAAMRIAKGSVSNYEKSLMSRNDMWHKIEIYRGGSMDKELVLKSILQAVQPIDLIPVRYTINGDDSFFLIRNCDNALQKLCALNLIIKTVSGELLLLTITLGYASIHDLKMNIRPLLLALLTKRYQYGKKMLNLNSFHRDPDITNTVYCPLSLPRTLSSVLNIAIKDLSSFEKLCLRYNELSSLTGMEAIKLNITSLDLRNNQLLNVDLLAPLKEFNIIELWLDGNPLCENFSTPKRYIDSVRKYCPNLSRLDGVYIGSPSLPISYNNFVPNEKREDLILQFIRHFFVLYDSRDRGILQGIYHKRAYCSTSLDSTFAARLKKTWINKNNKHNLMSFVLEHPVPDSDKVLPLGLSLENRNLLNLTGEDKDYTSSIYHGSEAILRLLKRLPETKHYHETFTYQLLFDTGRCVSFTIDGIFRDKMDEKFVFNRTFVLVTLEDDEYKILNDQNLIFCLSIKDLKLDEEIVGKNQSVDRNLKLKCLSESEIAKLVKQMKRLTRMKEKYCQKFLENSGWNLRKAVSAFMVQYRGMHIPREAFI